MGMIDTFKKISFVCLVLIASIHFHSVCLAESNLLGQEAIPRNELLGPHALVLKSSIESLELFALAYEELKMRKIQMDKIRAVFIHLTEGSYHVLFSEAEIDDSLNDGKGILVRISSDKKRVLGVYWTAPAK